MLHSRKKFLAMLLTSATGLALLLTASTAQANPRHSASRLATVLEKLSHGAEMAREGRDFAAKRAVRTSYYQIRSVLWNLERTRGNGQAVEALNVAIEKLQDDYLSTEEQLFFGLDCVGAALEALVTKHMRGRDAVAMLLKAADKLGQGYAIDRSVSLLYAADQKLRRTMCPIRGRQVLEAISVAIEKAEDQYLTIDEKAYFINDCIRVALRNL